MTCSVTSALAVPAAGYGSSRGAVSRVGGVGEVPALDRRGVDAGDGQAGAVGAPPVAAEAAHLLGGDEVGAAPRDRLGLVVLAAGQDAPAAVELADAQQPAADVGDALGERIGTGVEHRAGDGQLAGLARHSPPTNSRPAMAKAVTVTAASVAKAVMPPAPSRARSRRARSSGGSSSSSRPPSRRLGVGDEALVAGRRVDDPQAVDRVGAAAAAQEHDALAVGRHDDVARLAERVALRAGRLAGVRVGAGGVRVGAHEDPNRTSGERADRRRR